MFCRLFFWICVLNVAVAETPSPPPLPLKLINASANSEKPVKPKYPSGVYIGKDGSVGASWGGYSASAGLGGLVGGAGPRGGLHAQAGTPDGHFAAAGLGGSVSEGAGPEGQLYSVAGQAKPVIVEAPVVQPVATAPVIAGGSSSQASASSSSSSSSGNVQGGVAPVLVNRRPGSFFDDIFNIPISTLGAVNQYLNNRNKVATVPSGVVRVQQVQPVQTSQSNAYSSSSASSGSSSSASSAAQAGVSSGIDNNIYHGYQKNPNYNDIFNIPISVLGAVNRFLNGK